MPNPFFVLGPSVTGVVEPAVVVPYPYSGITLADPPTLPGGTVRFTIDPTPAGHLRPAAVHAVYVGPPEAVPAGPDRTAEWFLGSGHPKAAFAVEGPTDGVVELAVPVAPGLYHVQTVLEYHPPEA